jgi:hypothetical protein
MLLAACNGGGAGSQGAAPTDPTTSTTLPAMGFVQRSGTQLTVDGRPWHFIGYNLPCANPFVMEDAQLAHYLDLVQQDSGANTIRVWFFQTNGGPGNWAPFDRVLHQLAVHNMRAVVTLTNEWNGGCDAGAGVQKTIDWYQGGYRQPDAGHKLSFRDYAAAVAQHYANSPEIAMWQLVNEAQANTLQPSGALVCDNAAAAKALRAFADDMTGAIKAVDPHHLVNLGTLGGGQCGLQGASYQYVHAGLVDVCEYHDYGASASALPSGPDQLAQRIQECAALPSGGKPLFVGESGIQGNVQPDGGPAACTPWPTCSPDPLTSDTLSRRAAFFQAKLSAAFKAGVVGYVIWVKSPYYNSNNDIYAIGDGDPTEGAVRAASAQLGV